MKKVRARHKTQYPVYRRAGVLLRDQWQELELSDEQVAVLKADAWVELAAVDAVAVAGDSDEGSADDEGLPEGWSASKAGNWWTFVGPDGAEHKLQGGKSAAEAYEKLLAEKDASSREASGRAEQGGSNDDASAEGALGE